jgi:ABC-type nitrate/sulfonate/bicarbonate transport system substrate-binding protein
MDAKTIPSRRSLLTAGLAIGAGIVMPAARARATDLKPVSFQLSWIKSIQYGGFFAGVDTGAYKRHGIDATFNSGGPNIDPVANVASGQSMFGDRPIGPLIIAREKGIPIKVIGTVFQKSPFSIMSLAKTPIRTIKELEGKTLAVSTSSKPLVLNLLKDAGLSERSVNLVPAAPDPAALVTGQIDAYTGYSTNQGTMLQARGIDIVMLNAADLGLPETTGTIYAREDFLKDNHDLTIEFLKASIEAWHWGLDHPDETAKLMVEKYGAPGLDYQAQFTEIKASRPFIEADSHGLLSVDTVLIDQIIGLYRKAGLVKSDMKAAELCDTSFVKAALAS